MSVIDDFIKKKSGPQLSDVDNDERVLKWSREVSHMLNNPVFYGYAESTLISIYEFIDKNGRITDGQIQAVQNIKANPSKPYVTRRKKRR